MEHSKDSFIPPHSLDAEKAVLGAILRNPENYHLVIDKVNLEPDNFFLDSHRRIFEEMVHLDNANKVIDIITISDQLFKDNLSETSFNPAYLIELTESCPITENIEYYGSIVREKFYLRRVIKACQNTIQKATRSESSAGAFIEEVESEFLGIANEQDLGTGLTQAKDIIIPTLEELERRINAEGFITGVSSGFHDLDKITGGWQKSDLIILAGRPGMGKTALGLNWAMNAVREAKKTTAIFTLEMSKNQLMERLLSSEGRIDSTSLRKGDMSEDDQDRLMQAARMMNENGSYIVIDETPGISVSELRSRCRRYKKEHGLDLVVIDYLQLMRGTEIARKQGREREIGEISMGLKSLAKELGVPVIAMAQLNRGPDSRPDKRPKISDLRESGSMEQDADQILFVYRDDYYNPNSEFAGKAEVIIAKNRHGETASVYLAWLPNFVSFHNLLKE